LLYRLILNGVEDVRTGTDGWSPQLKAMRVRQRAMLPGQERAQTADAVAARQIITSTWWGERPYVIGPDPPPLALRRFPSTVVPPCDPADDSRVNVNDRFAKLFFSISLSLSLSLSLSVCLSPAMH
jgi:hypothetical protein